MILAASSSSSGSAVVDLDVERRTMVMRRVSVALGQTRPASPPPGVSWRAVLVVVLLGDLGLVLLALDLGFLNP